MTGPKEIPQKNKRLVPSPAASLDVQSALASRLAVANALTREAPEAVAKAKDPHGDGTDAHGLARGYLSSAAAVKGRFIDGDGDKVRSGAGGGRQAANAANAAAQTAAALGLVQPTSRVQKSVADKQDDDPTGAARALANLKLLAERGTSSAQLSRSAVTKAKKPAYVACRDADGQLIGIVPEDKTRDTAKAGDEVYYNADRSKRWFANPRDVRPIAGPSSTKAAPARKKFTPSPAPPEISGVQRERVTDDGGRTYRDALSSTTEPNRERVRKAYRVLNDLVFARRRVTLAELREAAEVAGRAHQLGDR